MDFFLRPCLCTIYEQSLNRPEEEKRFLRTCVKIFRVCGVIFASVGFSRHTKQPINVHDTSSRGTVTPLSLLRFQQFLEG